MLQEIIEVALHNVRVYFHMHVTDCRMFYQNFW